ncbi:hypothetical protein [Paenibacillus contaminans]|uniref:Uncharacterized protein n=1 Tax=Paenibacillus contaminans TaxID=450362 RepID=A0A329MRQ7_9BACL|nr:hypothetical protein [Paenibacillus contaminans]RAV22242.1 hypothetical protein DQG23_04625 [Paenibacillus contaminans]
MSRKQFILFFLLFSFIVIYFLLMSNVDKPEGFEGLVIPLSIGAFIVGGIISLFSILKLKNPFPLLALSLIFFFVASIPIVVDLKNQLRQNAYLSLNKNYIKKLEQQYNISLSAKTMNGSCVNISNGYLIKVEKCDLNDKSLLQQQLITVHKEGGTVVDQKKIEDIVNEIKNKNNFNDNIVLFYVQVVSPYFDTNGELNDNNNFIRLALTDKSATQTIQYGFRIRADLTGKIIF